MTGRVSRWLVGLCAAGALVIAGSAFGAAFTNGSFETGPTIAPSAFITLGVGDTSITGWTVTSGSIDYIGSYWTAEDGSRSLDMNGSEAGAIEQTFDTMLGYRYTVTFYLAGNGSCPPTVKHLNVGATGNPPSQYTFDTTGHTTSSMGWQQETYTFVATGTSTTLSFQTADSGSCGPALDNVSVTVAPPIPAFSPAMGAVLALLLAALGWIALGRRFAA